MSVLSVAVPDAFSISSTKSAFVGADVAVLAVDCRVRSPPSDVNVELLRYLMTTIPEPPAP